MTVLALMAPKQDVQFFNVMDEVSGKHVASFYLDPYSRNGKQSGAWFDECRQRHSVSSNAVSCFVYSIMLICI